MASETNVRIPDSAHEAVARIVARRRPSRDDTVRWLLVRHLVKQEALEADDRLTHISTVIRYRPIASGGVEHVLGYSWDCGFSKASQTGSKPRP